jgi:hypothetical protein
VPRRISTTEAREVYGDFTKMTTMRSPVEVAELDDGVNDTIGRHARLRRWLAEYLRSIELRAALR